MAAALANFFANCKEYMNKPKAHSHDNNAKPMAFETYWMFESEQSLIEHFQLLPDKYIQNSKVQEPLKNLVLSCRTQSRH